MEIDSRNPRFREAWYASSAAADALAMLASIRRDVARCYGMSPYSPMRDMTLWALRDEVAVEVRKVRYFSAVAVGRLP